MSSISCKVSQKFGITISICRESHMRMSNINLYCAPCRFFSSSFHQWYWMHIVTAYVNQRHLRTEPRGTSSLSFALQFCLQPCIQKRQVRYPKIFRHQCSSCFKMILPYCSRCTIHLRKCPTRPFPSSATISYAHNKLTAGLNEGARPCLLVIVNTQLDRIKTCRFNLHYTQHKILCAHRSRPSK